MPRLVLFVGGPFDLAIVTESLEARLDVIHFIVRVERIIFDAEFVALTRHDVHGIVENTFDDEITLLRQNDVCFGKISQRYGQRADVIVMAMGDRNRIEVFVLDGFVERETVASLTFGVHSGVEQDAVIFDVHEPGTGSDVRVRIEIGDTHKEILPA